MQILQVLCGYAYNFGLREHRQRGRERARESHKDRALARGQPSSPKKARKSVDLQVVAPFATRSTPRSCATSAWVALSGYFGNIWESWDLVNTVYTEQVDKVGEPPSRDSF